MVSFNDITKNANFGRLYNNSSMFRTIFDKYRNREDLSIGDLMPKLKIGMGPDGQATFTYGPSGVAGSFEAARDQAIFGTGLRQTRNYTGDLGTTHSVSGSTNSFADLLASKGYNVSLTGSDMPSGSAVAAYLNQFKAPNKADGSAELYGLIIPKQDKVNALSVTDKSGRRLTMTEIQNLIGGDMSNEGSVFKRLGVMTSERELGIARDPGLNLENAFRVKTFDPAMGRSANVASATKALADRLNISTDQIYSKMTDGLNFMSDSGFKKFIGELTQKANDMIKAGRGDEGRELLEKIKKARSTVAAGGSFNARLVNGINVDTGSQFKFLKGDVHVGDQYIKSRLPGFDPSSADVFTSMYDEKKEFGPNSFSMMTLEDHGIPRTASMNAITLGLYQDNANPNGYLFKGAEAEIAAHEADLRAGKISPGLRQILDEMDDRVPDASEGPAANKAALEGKRFARSMKKMIDSGVNPASDDFLMTNLHKAMSKHYTTFRKGHHEQTLRVGLEDINHYSMNLPMAGSVTAHMLPDDNIMSGMLRFPEKGKRPEESVFKLNSLDAYKTIEAWGGSDFDDRINASLRYDPEAKRLIAQVFRDPVAMGEYMMFDADIAVHSDMPLAIRQKWSRAHQLKTQMQMGNSSMAQKQVLKDEYDSIAPILDSYFRGQEVNIGGQTLRQDFINPIDLAKELIGPRASLPAPNGYRVDQSLSDWNNSSIRSFKTSQEIVGSSNTTAYMRRLRSEAKREASADAGMSMFEFVGHGHREYAGPTRGFFTKPTISEKIPEVGRLNAAQTIRRLEIEADSNGALGRVINSQFLTKEFERSHTKGLSDKLYGRYEQLIKADPFIDIPSELGIDAYVKTGNTEILQKGEESIMQNARKLGSLIGTLQKEANGEFVGLDPVTYRARLASNSSALTAFTDAYKTASGKENVSELDFLLPSDDAKAYSARQFKKTAELERSLNTSRATLADEARANRMKDLVGMNFTPEEIQRSSEFIEHMSKTSRDINNALTNMTAQQQEAVLSAYGEHDISKMTDKEIARLMHSSLDIDDTNTAAIRKLREMGLFNEADGMLTPTAALDRQVLAVSDMLARNGSSSAMLHALGEKENGSLEDLVAGALQRRVYGPRAIEQIRGINTMADLENMLSIDRQSNSIRYGTELMGIADPGQRAAALLGRMGAVSRNGAPQDRARAVNYAQKLFDDLERTGQVQDKRRLRQVRQNMLRSMEAERPSKGYMTLPPITPARRMGMEVPGSNRLIGRGIADQAAEEVTTSGPVREIAREMISHDFTALLNEPLAKKGLIGAGIFAGIGLLYRLTKDPTPEEMQGPPLLPGGSAYENITPATYAQEQSMYPTANYGGGMIYKVNVNGDFNPQALGAKLKGIGGSQGNTTIYKSRQTTSGSRKSSMQMMQERNG